MEKRVALYAGSFDPYTNGHHAIVRKAAALFDEVVVLIGVNIGKRRATDAEAMRAAIQQTLDAEGLNARAELWTGLIADYCARHGIKYYVRGLRNAADYAYEEGLAQVNARLNPNIETLYLRGDDTTLSSSVVRELHAFGHDVAEFVPEAVYELMIRNEE